ncbi:helix-turn-helix domain-containing protein [Amycolatopsis sp. 195334CR]|uniref:PucR family transcriptional regulator n=1 Tax=Amycolatopsis sp. 195334CR TaxID=2814588 RepID=UPI0027DB87E8|nr:helix-turn-helix domain-containing protein [Amycolatopsis sp. 195334CR]
MDERTTAIALHVVRALASDPAVLGRAVEAARRSSPEVARLPAAENRRHIATLLTEAVAHLERGDEHEAGDFSAAFALGADRAAQGVPIIDLLRGVHAGRAEVTRAGVDAARAAGVDEATILEFIVDLDHYVGAVQRQIVSGYHTAELELSRTARDLSTQVLRQLLLPGERLPDAEALGRAGLTPERRYHCVVSAVTDPRDARSLEQQLAPFGGVYGFVEGTLTGVAPHNPALPGDAPVVVTSPARPLLALRDTYPLCSQALAVASERGLAGVQPLVGLAAETALAAHPALARTLAGELLAPLDPANEFHQEIAATAVAFLDHGCVINATAKALHIHANTVRYRLDRLNELVGIDVNDRSHPYVVTAMQTWWALRTWLQSR